MKYHRNTMITTFCFTHFSTTTASLLVSIYSELSINCVELYHCRICEARGFHLTLSVQEVTVPNTLG